MTEAGAERAIETAQEAGFVFAREVVLPDAEDAPAAGAEGAGVEAGAGAVGGNLWPFAPRGHPPTTTPARRYGATRDV
jgi:hypothetical protein